MREWNKCKQVAINGEPAINVDSKQFAAFMRYCNEVGSLPRKNVWYDTVEDKCFGLDLNWINSNSKSSSVITEKEHFLLDHRWGPTYVHDRYGQALGHDVIFGNEIIHQNLPALEKFKGSKVLLVGGGPTTNESNWNPEDYDYLWTCNHFFMNDKLSNLDFSLIAVGDEVDLTSDNTEFHKYLSTHDSLCCFEDSDRPTEEMVALKEQYPDRCFYSHTRYRAKIGVMPRLLCMALLFGVKELHFVGVDGVLPETIEGEEGVHSFQKNKANTGTSNYDLYRRHYVMLWDYVLNELDLKDVKLQNLGEGHPANHTTDISKEMFPLEK